MLYLGCFFLWGNISIYVLSYFHEKDPTASYDFIFVVDVFLVFSNWCGYWVGTYLFQIRRWHPKLVITLGCVISLSGVFLSSYTVSIGPFLGLYCVMNGIGSGMCYLVPLICGWEWFPKSKGLVTGCTLGGYGFGSFIFALLSTKLVNPNNIQANVKDVENADITFYGPEVADNVPFMIRTLVYIWCGLAFIGILLISRKPKETEVLSNLGALGDQEETENENLMEASPNVATIKTHELSNEEIDDL